jgi:hypothetical protein
MRSAASDACPLTRMRLLFRHHARFPCAPSDRSSGRTIAALWAVFHAPADAHARLHLRDGDILPSTSREALFLALARALCEPRGWAPALHGSCFSFEDGRSLFLLTCRLTCDPAHGPVREWFFSKTAVHQLCAPPEAPCGDRQHHNPPQLEEGPPGANPAAAAGAL